MVIFLKMIELSIKVAVKSTVSLRSINDICIEYSVTSQIIKLFYNVCNCCNVLLFLFVTSCRRYSESNES